MRESELCKILVDFQNSSGQSPKQPILTVKLALLLSGSWTGFSRGSFNMNYSPNHCKTDMGHALRRATEQQRNFGATEPASSICSLYWCSKRGLTVEVSREMAKVVDDVTCGQSWSDYWSLSAHHLSFLFIWFWFFCSSKLKLIFSKFSMKILKNARLGNVSFVRPELQFEFRYSYFSKRILI